MREPSSESKIWWGKYNRPVEPVRFEQLKVRLQAYLQGRDVFVQDCYAGADPDYRVKVRVITEARPLGMDGAGLRVRLATGNEEVIPVGDLL